MGRFRLRHQSAEIELPEGEFVIGRSAECDLPLEDSRVSRRHARLIVRANAVILEDLGSRNGVYIEGRRVTAPYPLRHLTRMSLGAQELTLVEVERERSQTIEAVVTKCGRCGAHNLGADRCARCDAALHGPDADTLGGERRPRTPSSAFRVVSGLAEKALALGKRDEAERLLRPQLEAVLDQAESEGAERSVDDETFEAATSFALQLASSGQGAEWIDWLFTLHTRTGRLMSVEVIDALHESVRRAGYSSTKGASAYVSSLAAASANFGPAERFRLSRLEGLVRVLRG